MVRQWGCKVIIDVHTTGTLSAAWKGFRFGPAKGSKIRNRSEFVWASPGRSLYALRMFCRLVNPKCLKEVPRTGTQKGYHFVPNMLERSPVNQRL